MNKYHHRIEQLFGLLALANTADCAEREDWQESWDASSQHFFGHICQAIVSIAGADIVEHWAETNEIDYSLADRN